MEQPKGRWLLDTSLLFLLHVRHDVYGVEESQRHYKVPSLWTSPRLLVNIGTCTRLQAPDWMPSEERFMVVVIMDFVALHRSWWPR